MVGEPPVSRVALFFCCNGPLFHHFISIVQGGSLHFFSSITAGGLRALFLMFFLAIGLLIYLCWYLLWNKVHEME